MALRNEEILRLKYELGFNITGIGAEVYITYTAIFDRAIQPYLIDVGTTSSTAVTAAPGGASTTITLAANPVSSSATQALSFVVGSNVVVDVGPAGETAVIAAINSLAITLTLVQAHSSTYPVLINGAEQTVRDLFTRLDAIRTEMLNVAPKTAGMQQVDELQFTPSTKGRSKTMDKFGALLWQRDEARRDLAGALGVPYMRDVRNRGSGGGMSVY